MSKRDGVSIALLLLGVPSCAPSYELLASSGGAPSAGAPAAASGTAGTSSGTAGLDGSGGSGYSLGGQGGALLGGSSGGGVPAGGVTGAGGYAPDGSLCVTHGGCWPGSICRANVCQACPVVDTCVMFCPPPLMAVKLQRNGCELCECAPPSECDGDAACPLGEICYRGRQCHDGCNDASCCYGNQCSPPGCAASIPGCLATGCDEGKRCVSECESFSCECAGESWDCVGTLSGGLSTTDLCSEACLLP